VAPEELELLGGLPAVTPLELELELDLAPEELELLGGLPAVTPLELEPEPDVAPEELEPLGGLPAVMPPELDPEPDVTPEEPELLGGPPEVLITSLTVPLELELELVEALLESPGCVTRMEKFGSFEAVRPLVAVMMIFGYSPISEALGVPESWPVATLKIAHTGLFSMLKASVPVETVVLGWNRYSELALTVSEGVPEMLAESLAACPPQAARVAANTANPKTRRRFPHCRLMFMCNRLAD
jgi:hypothetical protein